MRKPTPLQISFGLSIFLHVTAIGLCRIYGFWPFDATSGAKNNSDIIIRLALVSAPDEPPALNPAAEPDPPATKTAKLEPVESLPIREAAASAPVPQTPSEPEPVAAPEESAAAVVPVVIAHPNYLKNLAPEYPMAARRRHQEGLVLLTVQVTAGGRALKVDIKKSSGFVLLDDAAVKAVKAWEFEPARVGTVSLESEVEVPIRFELPRH